MECDLIASVAFLSGGVVALHSEHGACPVEVAAEHGACSAPDLTRCAGRFLAPSTLPGGGVRQLQVHMRVYTTC